jgi:hypothetical protein
MPKIVRCENPGCRVEAVMVGVIGNPPAGWFSIIERRPGSEPDVDFLACSRRCAAELLAAVPEEIAHSSTVQ